MEFSLRACEVSIATCLEFLQDGLSLRIAFFVQGRQFRRIRFQQMKNQLEEIPGVGPKTRRKLIRKFGSVTGVSRASVQELSIAIGEQKAKTVIAFLKDILKT